jgi:uncharacterized membrane protein
MEDSKYMSLLVAYYDEEDAARSTLAALRIVEKPGAIRIVESALIRVDEEGKLIFTQAADRRGIRRITRGAVVGGLFGVIFPPSILAMTAVGSVAAAAWNHFRDQGFEKNLLKEIGENVSPGGAAVAAVVEDQWLAQAQSALEGYALLQRYIVDVESFAGLELFERNEA